MKTGNRKVLNWVCVPCKFATQAYLRFRDKKCPHCQKDMLAFRDHKITRKTPNYEWKRIELILRGKDGHKEKAERIKKTQYLHDLMKSHRIADIKYAKEWKAKEREEKRQAAIAKRELKASMVE